MVKKHEFWTSDSGDMYRLPINGKRYVPLSDGVLIREGYSRHHRTIETGRQLRECLRAGEFAFPGGYGLYFVTDDGVTLSFQAIRDNIYGVLWSIRNGCSDGWRVVAVGCECNTDGPVYCNHTGELIAGEED